MFTNYLLPFETAAVILTVAVIAAIMLTLRRRTNTKYQNPSRQVAACWGAKPAEPPGAILYADPRLPALGYRAFLTQGSSPTALGCEPASEQDYHAFRIGLGVPEGGKDYAFGDAFPHEALFDQLHGVDFEKGCFVGQEVVSRMEHRGTARNRIVPVYSPKGTPLKGSEIKAGGKTIGTVLSAADKDALALIRLDRLKDAVEASSGLLTEAGPIHVRKPGWARFDVALPKDDE